MSDDRRYQTEFHYNVHASHFWSGQQDALTTGHTQPDRPYHLYAISRQRKIRIERAELEGDVLKLDLIAGRGADTSRRQLVFSDFHEGALIEISPSETRLKVILDELGGGFIMPTTYMLLHHRVAYWDALDQDILYIGQSYGTDGSRSAISRLLDGHPALAEAYFLVQQESPEYEVHLTLFNAEATAHTEIVPTAWEQPEMSDDADNEHIDRVTEHFPWDEQHAINILEAGLIRYFKPRLNVKFKDSVPSPAHRTYETCFDLDLRSVTVEYNPEDIRVGSAHIEPRHIHIAPFNLRTRQERAAFFDMSSIA